MTGDGVNDAPGAAAGRHRRRDGHHRHRRGARRPPTWCSPTTTSRPSSRAVEEGRRIYDNIRSFVRYLLTTQRRRDLGHVPRAVRRAAAAAAARSRSSGSTSSPTGCPASRSASSRPSRTSMRRPPRPPGESIFARGLWQHALSVGLLMAAVALGAPGRGAWARTGPGRRWSSRCLALPPARPRARRALRARESLFTLGLSHSTPAPGAVVVCTARPSRSPSSTGDLASTARRRSRGRSGSCCASTACSGSSRPRARPRLARPRAAESVTVRG